MTEEEHSPKQEQEKSSGFTSFWNELKRRKVMRVAIAYLAVAWLLIQIAATVFPQIGMPDWAPAMVTWIFIIGFPIAVIIAWAFELTPDGIKTTKSAREEQGDTPVSEKQQRKRNWLAYAVGAALPTVIFGTLALIFYFQAQKDVPVVEGDKSIAVLPLDNLSPDPEIAYFADGVQEEVLTNLSKIGELLVIGRTSTLQYRDSVKTLRQIGQELDVRYLVEGSVFRAGNDVRVTVQLIDSMTEGHLWADRYDRNLDNTLGIMSEIAKDIASELHAAISPEEIQLIDRMPTKNREAYDYFLEANVTQGASRKFELYEKAVELDPNFAEAWAYMAWFKAVTWQYTKQRNDPALLDEIHYALNQAIRINPNLPHVLHAQGNVIDITQGDIETAIEYFLKALEVEPNFDPSKQALGLRLYRLPRLAEAQHYWEDALRSNPISGPNLRLVDLYVSRKNWDKARALIEKSLAFVDSAEDPRNDVEGFLTRYLARIDYYQTGDKDAYLRSIYQSPGYQESAEARSAKLLCDRDFDAALLSLADEKLGANFNQNLFGVNGAILLGGTWEIQPPLVWFERESKDQWLLETQKAKDYLTDIVENDPLVSPLNWSNLAICYSLENNLVKLEETISKVRELTLQSRWKFQRQARCEVHIAICYLVLGDNEKALEILEAASQMNPSFLLNRYIDTWFIFDRLRGNRRFEALLRGEVLGPSVEAAQVEELPHKTIAVLPFANMSEDASNEYFSDGISEELLNVLAKIPKLRVPARTSSFYFKGKNVPVKEIGEALNVEYILEGSVRKAGDQVRITAQLAKAADGYHIWSDTFTRDLKDIFALQDEIAGLIAEQLQLELGFTPKAQPVDPEAHRLVLEAIYYNNQRGMDNFDKAIELLERALKIDPNFAKAHATMALVHSRRMVYSYIDYETLASEDFTHLYSSATRALELDPASTDAMVAMSSGLRNAGKIKEGNVWSEKAFALNPNDSRTINHRAFFFLAKGELLAASKAFGKVLENDPLDFVTSWVTGNIAMDLGRFQDALRLYNRADSLSPRDWIPSKSASGLAMWMLGQKNEAIKIARSIRQSWPSDPRASSDIDAIWVLVQAGLEEEVSEYSEMLFSELPPQSFKRGFILTTLGRFEEAVPYLERIPVAYLDDLAGDYLFDTYRDDPRFHQLLETLNWTEEYKKARADIEKAKSMDL